MKTRMTILSALFFLLLMLGSASSQPGGSPDYDSADLARIHNKLNVYIEMLNASSNRTHDSLTRYLSWVDPKTGPTGKERYISYGLYTINDPSYEIENTRQIASKPPAVDTLDNSALQYSDIIGALYPLLNEAVDYYDQEDYKDDDAQKGREMHPKLMAAFKGFVEADSALRLQLTLVMGQLELQEINELKQNKQMFTYWIRYSMLQAKKTMHTGNNSFESIDLSALESAVKEYGDAVSALKQYVRSHPKETQSITSMDMFITSHKECLTAAKKLMRRKRDNKAYTEIEAKFISGGSGWMVEGSPGQLLKEYNELIDCFNRMN